MSAAAAPAASTRGRGRFRLRLAVVLLTVAVMAGALVAVSGRVPGGSTAAPAEAEGLTVKRASLTAGRIVLVARNGGGDAVRLSQVIVNDAFVDFRADRLAVPPSRETRVAIDYPWIPGESYEIELLTSTGATAEYELEDAGAV
jgi:zinc transporter, ZIP family